MRREITEPGEDLELRGLRTMTRVLDAGVDPLLGLILPGLGDAIGMVLGLGVVASAVRRRLPAIVIARMLLNLAIDAALGAVPVIGDLFDLGYRANRRNFALLTERHATRRATAKDWAFVVGAVMLVVAAVAGSIYVTYRLVAWLL
jgi:hypothetical protein